MRVRRVPRLKKLVELLVRQNDILLNATNSPDLVGKNAVFRGFSEPITFSNHFIRLRLKSQIADSGLVSRWLTDQWRRGIFRSMCRRWVNQASLNKDQLLNLNIGLPPLDEQRRIAAILDQADTIRNKRREALEKLKQTCVGAFHRHVRLT
jgi:type I restriction enzyme, S subunit